MLASNKLHLALCSSSSAVVVAPFLKLLPNSIFNARARVAQPLRCYNHLQRRWITSAQAKTMERNGIDYSALDVQSPIAGLKPLNVPEKLLMGPGPSNCDPRVLKASSLPILGHMHKEFFQIMDEIKIGLQYLFQTSNPWTLVIPGPGHLGMEAMLVNLLEPGETVLIGVNGIWGLRAADLANRLGLVAGRLEKEPGSAFTIDEIEAGLIKHKPKVLFLIHSESSAGLMQPLDGVGDLCQRYDCLLVVDTVASMGGVPFFTDRLKVDAMYTGSQKVIGAPPGMAPCTFGPRAIAKIKSRTTPIKSYLLDMNELSVYWACSEGDVRFYHHTPPVTLFYALRESLAQIAAEGLPNLWKRHAENSQRLYAGLGALGLEFLVQNPVHRLPTVTSVKVPVGIDWKHVTQFANDKFLMEIAGGLGPTAGKIFRLGVLGHNAYPDKVDRLLVALKEGLEYSKLHGRL